MKKINYLLAAALFIAAGCEKSPVDQGNLNEGNLYMQFSVKMLSTRSQTDNTGDSNSNANPDTEVGLDKENTISTVDIALVGGGSTVVASNVTPTAANKSTYVAKFDTKALVAGTTYKVYIYANCPAPSVVDVDAVSEATIAEMTADNKFWMTNAHAALDVTLPTDLAPYTQPNTPLSLGAHTVERSMARFDYKQAGAFDMGAGITLTLTDAALINQSKAHYMFRRVTADANTSSDVTVGGAEIPTNWVVDTDWGNKVAANFDAQLEAPSTWDWTSLASLTTDDQYDGDYKIWCYAKENTIPGTTAQKHNVSTGVVFKGELAAGEGASDAVKTALRSGKRIYVLNNTLYGAWSDVKVAATAENADPTLAAAYNQAAASITGEATDPTSTAAAAAGFTGYSPKDGKYYVYYYYWNRHNDNLDPYTMGTMEFAVVRNNVYKLAVNAINRFGHPTPPTGPTDPDPDPDPDPVDPDDPDESVNYYFNVTVKVLPWTVRINNIEF